MISKIIFLLLTLAAAEETAPFWKSKPEVYKKMKEDRYIAVSAHVNNEKKLKIVAAGIIHAPLEFSNSKILEFKEYPQFLSYILESPYDPTTKNIFFHGAVLGYHVHMTIHVDPEKTDKGARIKWRSIEGGFVGMEGAINEEDIDPQHTEISLDSSYQGKSLGIPAFLLDWGLEFAGQRTAWAMRDHIESEWEKSKKH